MKDFIELLRSDVTRTTIERACQQRQTVAVYQEMSEVLTRVALNQMMVVVTRDYAISAHLINDGYWELWLSRFLAHRIKPGDAFIDGGANLGWYSLLAAHLGAAVVAFEPLQNFGRLVKASAQMQGVPWSSEGESASGSIVWTQAALWDEPGVVRLTLSFENFGGSRVTDSETEKSSLTHRDFNAAAVRLDDAVVLDTERRFIVKLDVEGAELRALRGMPRILERPDTALLVEWHRHPEQDRALMQEVIDQLHGLGYRVQRVTGESKLEPIPTEYLLAEPKAGEPEFDMVWVER